MSALSIQPTFPILTDIDGQPLEDGYIWLGVAGSGNPIANPQTAYWDAALTQTVTQPVRTRGGYPMNAGVPGRLYVNGDYSIRINNRNGSTIYSATNATERYNDAVVQIDSSDVTFIQAGTGAVTRTAQAKMRETVSVKDFGAVGDGVTDDTAAIQAAIDYAISASRDIYFPAGTYVVSTTIAVDLRVPGSPTQRKNVSISGDGSHLTKVVNNLSSLTNATFNFIGAASVGVNNGDHGFALSGITIQRPTIDYQGVGIGMFDMTGPLISDVVVVGFNKGVICTDVLFADFQEFKVRSCNEGHLMQYADYSRANLTSFRNCSFSDSTIFGVKVYGCNVEFDTCGFESNGIRNAGYTCHSLWYQDSPDGYPGLVVKNSYFEANKGEADVYINAAWTGTHSLESNSFNRVSSTNYVTANILLTNIVGLSGTEQHLSLSNNGFLSVGTYVPNVARPKLLVQNVSGYLGWQLHDASGNPGLYSGVDAFDINSAALRKYTSLVARAKNTYTPVAEGDTGTPGVGTYTNQTGIYERIGDLVFFSVRIAWTSHTGSGTFKISLPPIAPDTTSVPNQPISFIYSGVSYTATQQMCAYVRPALNTTVGSGCVQVLRMEPTGTLNAVVINTSAAYDIYLSGFYRALP